MNAICNLVAAHGNIDFLQMLKLENRAKTAILRARLNYKDNFYVG